MLNGRAKGERATDYDAVAERYDVRYGRYSYAGVRDTVLSFLGDATAVLEVGCGTGHWLAEIGTRLKPSPFEESRGRAVQREGFSRASIARRHRPLDAMLARARRAAPAAQLVRRPRRSVCRGATSAFDRVFCVNALHHFTDRAHFFAEARRVLRPGGGLLTIGKDPHREGDTWWVYDYFDGDPRDRSAPLRAGQDAARRADARRLRVGRDRRSRSHRDQVPAAAALADGADGVVTPSVHFAAHGVIRGRIRARGRARSGQADAAAGGALQTGCGFQALRDRSAGSRLSASVHARPVRNCRSLHSAASKDASRVCSTRIAVVEISRSASI